MLTTSPILFEESLPAGFRSNGSDEPTVANALSNAGFALLSTLNDALANHEFDKALKCLDWARKEPLIFQPIWSKFPISWFIWNDQPAFVGHLIDVGHDLTRCDSSGRTVLHAAAIQNYFGLFEAMVCKGMDLEAKDKDGQTPLASACSTGHTQAAVALIDLGASMSTTDNQGNTPLHAAVQAAQSELCVALMSRGARWDQTNNAGKDTLELARSLRNQNSPFPRFQAMQTADTMGCLVAAWASALAIQQACTLSTPRIIKSRP